MVAVLAVVTIVVSGCGSKTNGGGFAPAGGGSPTSTTSGPTPTTSSSAASSAASQSALPTPSTMTTAQLKRSVLDAYKAYMAAYERAYEINSTSELSQYAVDPILGRVTKDIQADAAKHVIWRFHNVLNPRLQGWSTDQALVVVLDCVQNLGWYKYSLATGAKIGSKNLGNSYYQTHVKYVQGVWKIADVKVAGRC